jgi:rubrerythrin
VIEGAHEGCGRRFDLPARNGGFMDTKKMSKDLAALVQLDIDAIHAYDQAIDAIDLPMVKQQLRSFRDDHNRHVQTLSQVISRFGEKPPVFARDFKGFLIEGFTAARSVTGTAGALKAMRGNEHLTNRFYKNALALELPQDVKQIVQTNYEDEKRHLAYIEDAIEKRVWDIGEPAAPTP